MSVIYLVFDLQSVQAKLYKIAACPPIKVSLKCLRQESTEIRVHPVYHNGFQFTIQKNKAIKIKTEQSRQIFNNGHKTQLQ